MAQLVERPTEKPGAILTRVRVLGAANDFSPRVNFQCILSSACNRMHHHLCAGYKSKHKSKATPLFGHHRLKILGMDSAVYVSVS